MPNRNKDTDVENKHMDVKAAWGEEGRFGRLGLMYIHYDTMNKAYLMKHTVSLRELNALW